MNDVKPSGKKEQPKAHPAFIAVIVGVPLIGVILMAYSKGWIGGDGAAAEEENKKPEIIKTESPALKNWKLALKTADELSPQIHKITIRISDLEDQQLEGEDIKAARTQLIADLETLGTEVAKLDAAAQEVIKYYMEKDKLDEAQVLKKFERTVVKGTSIPFGKALADFKRMKGDVATKLRAAKAIGSDGEHGGEVGETK